MGVELACRSAWVDMGARVRTGGCRFRRGCGSARARASRQVSVYLFVRACTCVGVAVHVRVHAPVGVCGAS